MQKVQESKIKMARATSGVLESNNLSSILKKHQLI